MANKTNRFAFDWWAVQKRIVYLIIAVLVLCGLAGGAALYVWKYGNPLKNVGTNNVVETPKTKNKVGEQTGASFGVNPEGTEEIRVNAGVIETTDRGGEKTSLHGGEYAKVSPSGTVSRPQKLLDVPSPSEPRDLQKVFIEQNRAAT